MTYWVMLWPASLEAVDQAESALAIARQEKDTLQAELEQVKVKADFGKLQQANSDLHLQITGQVATSLALAEKSQW